MKFKFSKIWKEMGRNRENREKLLILCGKRLEEIEKNYSFYVASF